MERSCDTCQHEYLDIKQYPCVACERSYTDKWEEKCSHCNGDIPVTLVVRKDDGGVETIKANFCPKCGRDLYDE